ncbi:MAG TPA: NHL repeat-containing protein [Candidatus Baltobacteraceae bacterium]|jgi:6-phosphogluconolactonase (cycloisomerase 2 family)
MLRRLTLIFLSLVCTVAVAACSSSDTKSLSSGGIPGIGPNFASNSIYAASSSNNAVYIYAPNPQPSATPVNLIGGANTGLSGPQYVAFDAAKHLFVTNYNPAPQPGTNGASIQIYQTYAMGDVIPFGTVSGAGTSLTQPRGIAVDQKTGTFYVANVDPSAASPNELLVFASGGFAPTVISGNLTQLNSPTGVALDASNNLYVANRGGGSVTVYPAPTPVPAPSGSPSPAPTATPTANPSASPAPTPTPVPGLNIAPTQTITGLGAPTGIAVDANKNVYVADPDNGTPAIYVFAPGAASAAAATRKIVGASTQLKFPTDIKVDSNGTLYVADSGADAILIFAPNANGNVAPTVTLPFKAGTPIGLSLSP